MTDRLPWFRQDSDIATKVRTRRMLKQGRIGPALFVLDVCAEGYATGHGTDGVIDRDILDTVHGTPALARTLVELGIWVEHPDGWEIPDFAERQQLTATTATKRRLQSAGGAKGNCIRHHGPDCGCWRQGTTDDQ